MIISERLQEMDVQEMDVSEKFKQLPLDGSLKVVTDKKDYKSNTMIIRCPDDLGSPSVPEFHLATVDRSIGGTNYFGNAILDKLCPGLPKVKLPARPKPKRVTPPPSPTPPKKISSGQKDFHSTRRLFQYSSGGRTRSYHKKPRPERKGKSWTERSEKSWTERSEKSWPDRTMRPKAAEISPWEEGKQPWNNNVLGNIHVPVSAVPPMFGDNVPISMDYHEVVGRPANDYFVPHNDGLPLTPEYPHPPPGVFRNGPPKYPPVKGLLGDHPLECDPGHSYRNHGLNGDPLNNSFPRDAGIGNDYRNSNGDPLNNSFPRDAGIGNDYRNSNPRSDAAMNKSFQDNPRGGFEKSNFFKRKSFAPRSQLQNDERNSKAGSWNGNEGVRHNNRGRGQNRNRRGNRRGSNYRQRNKYL